MFFPLFSPSYIITYLIEMQLIKKGEFREIFEEKKKRKYTKKGEILDFFRAQSSPNLTKMF